MPYINIYIYIYIFNMYVPYIEIFRIYTCARVSWNHQVVPAEEQSWCDDLVTDAAGRCTGLLVHECHALKFLREEPHRKTYEIRSRPLKFLSEGARVALISISKGRTSQWKVLGKLEFNGNARIKASNFSKYFPFHQVSDDEFAQLGVGKKAEEWLWGWHFELVYELEKPLSLPIKHGPVTWCSFSPDQLGSSIKKDSFFKTYIYIYIHF